MSQGARRARPTRPASPQARSAAVAKGAPRAPSAPPKVTPITDNRKAFHDYTLMERLEAGIVLTGTEIKSIRAHRVNLRDAYAQARDGELWLFGLNISPWATAGPWQHDPLRPRRLLVHSREVLKFGQQAGQKGLTIVPVRLYIKGHHAKVELALAKGRREYDKRRALKERETQREIGRAMRQAR